MTHAPTPEQQAIISAAEHSTASLMIAAYAGTAKTTTIEMLASRLDAPSILALAFNVKIKEELATRLPSHFTVKTLNGLGHGAWMKATGKKITLDAGKLGKIITPLAKSARIELSKEEWVNVKDLVTEARKIGLIPSTFPHKGLVPDDISHWRALAEQADVFCGPELLDFARSVLLESCKQAFQGVIDFDDQIYMAALFNGVFPKFHTVIVDEAQDLSILNHKMLQKVVTHRLIVCGDKKQSLYAFRGADTQSMEKIRLLRADWLDFPLTLTFRCPKVVVDRQQEHAPGYRASENNLQGELLDWTEHLPPTNTPSSWGWKDIPQPGKLAILCRNNSPLIKLAFRLIRQNVACHMLGRDLGKNLIATLNKLALKPTTAISIVAATLLSWKDREAAVLRANEKDSALDKLHDRYESICAVMESAPVNTLGELVSAITSLFAKDKGLVTMATAHKAKGLEWDTVLHLDPWRVPSKFAKSDEDLQQEANVQYVIETRAKNTLILASYADFL